MKDEEKNHDYDKQIHDALVQLFHSEHPLDKSLEFDAVEFVNTRFPDSGSLDGVHEYAENLRDELRALDEEINSLVRNQLAVFSRGSNDVALAREAVGELRDRTVAIRDRAEESEKTVKSVSRDIMLLDTAKRNIDMTVTTLKRLVMMVNACEQLVELAQTREYSQTPALIISIKDLESAFDEVRHIPRVDELLKHKERIFNDLRLQILEDFELRILVSNPDLKPESNSGPRIISSKEDVMKVDLVGAAQSADALGDDVRSEIINKYCLMILDDYKTQFSPPQGPFADLTHHEKRLQWLTKALKEFTDRYANIFPQDWIVNGELCMHFCHETRQHFIDVLSHPSSDTSGTDPAELMVTVLVKLVELENDMQRRFDKLRKKLGLSEKEHLHFQGVITSCFDPHLNRWVQLEERLLTEIVTSVKAAGIKADELIGAVAGADAVPNSPRSGRMSTGDSLDTDPPLVYTSAVNLFARMRSSLQRCRQFNTGKVMADLFTVFRKVVGRYIDTVLRLRLPAGKHINAEDSLSTACAIVGSLDYCLKMTPHLHKNCMSLLNREIDVSVSSEIQKLAETRELAQETVVTCLLGGEVRTCIQTIAHLDWWNCGLASGVSPHIVKLRSALVKSIGVVGKGLTETHYRVAIEQFALKLIVQVSENVYSAKPVGEAGAQQLLVDVGEIKAQLLEIPGQVCPSKKVLQIYPDLVARALHRLECSLKALSSPAVSDRQALRAMLDALDPELAQSGPTSLDNEVNRILGLRKGPTSSSTMHSLAPVTAFLSNTPDSIESSSVQKGSADASPSNVGHENTRARPDLRSEMNRIGASIMKSKLFGANPSSK